jgi:hypothetical protein
MIVCAVFDHKIHVINEVIDASSSYSTYRNALVAGLVWGSTR